MRAASGFTALLILGLASGLTGCATFHQVRLEQSKTLTKINKAAPPKAPPFVRTVDMPDLVGTVVRYHAPAPAIFEKSISIMGSSPETLEEFGAEIERLTGIPVDVDLSNGAAKNQTAYQAPAETTLQWSSGPLRGLLQQLAGQFHCWWKFSQGRILFYRTETRSFTFPVFSQTTTSSSSISADSGGSSGGSGGGSGSSGTAGSTGAAAGTTGGTSDGSSNGGSGSVSVENSGEVSIWKNILKTAQLVGNGAIITANPSLGTLTATGTPPHVEAVARWARRLSRNLNRQVYIVVHVYTVQLNHEQNYGFNPNLAFQSVGAKYGVSFQGIGAPAVTGTQAPAALSAGVLKGPFSGSGVVVQALATMGNLVGSYTYPDTALNDEMVAIQSATSHGYLAETTPTVVSNGVATVGGLQPGQITTGFTALITPRIIGNRVILNLNLTISSLLSMQAQSSGDQTIYTPTTTSFSLPQVASLKSGGTLVLSKLMQNTANLTRNGVGSPAFPLLGGGADATSGKQLLVITVTARIL